MGEIYNCNYILVSNQLISLASRESFEGDSGKWFKNSLSFQSINFPSE